VPRGALHEFEPQRPAVVKNVPQLWPVVLERRCHWMLHTKALPDGQPGAPPHDCSRSTT
jgi:hypothetical protein